MQEQMYKSLVNIFKKYEELNNKLNSPEIAGDIKKYTKMTMEVNSIKDISISFGKYLAAESAIKEAKEMLASETDKEILEMAKMEIEENTPLLKPLKEELKILLLPKDKNDERNVIMEIRGAAGGNEANIFAGDLFSMYKG